MPQRFRSIALVVALAALASAASAANRTITLSVPSMNCSACPITVKTALQRVDGVQKVSVTYEPKEAVVTFDDAKATVDRLREATANAGFPSLLKVSK